MQQKQFFTNCNKFTNRYVTISECRECKYGLVMSILNAEVNCNFDEEESINEVKR